MKRFAKTVVKVLMAYSDVLKRDFPNHVKDESTVSTAVGLFISNHCCKNYLAPSISIDCCKDYLVIFISNDCCKNYFVLFISNDFCKNYLFISNDCSTIILYSYLLVFCCFDFLNLPWENILRVWISCFPVEEGMAIV